MMINTILTPPPTPSTPIESPASDAFDPGAFASIPLTALSHGTHIQLSRLLNNKKILRSEDGYERDYRGIGMLADLRGLYDENTSNMNDVLQLWCNIQPKTATFGKLEEFLGKIDRWDVSDDIHENLVKDANNYNAKQQPKSFDLANTQTNGNSFYDDTDSIDDWSDNPNILTRDDVIRAQKGEPLQNYDAFVLFAKEDVEYAAEMLDLEKTYNFKLCLKDRDLLLGVEFWHVALPELIEQRCKYLIVILTEQFFKSPENKFLVNFTQAHQIEENRRKIIPIRFGEVVIPRTLSILTHLNYQQSSRFFNFWDRLADSIRHGKQINGKIGPILEDNEIRSRAKSATAATLDRKKMSSKTNLILQTATQQRRMRSSTSQLNLDRLHSQASPPITPITPITPNSSIITQTPSPIPSISLNGEIIEESPNSPFDKLENGVGMRRSATIGNMAISNLELYANKEKKQSATMGKNFERSQSDHVTTFRKRYFPRFRKLLPKMRQAHSTSQLNVEVNMCERTTSNSDISTNSGVSEPKKKKKWSRKLKGIFSRSSNKLAETA